MTNTIDDAYQLQFTADEARRIADQAQAEAVAAFRKFADELDQNDLLKLSYECGEESDDSHCVYCAAWIIYVQRDAAQNPQSR